MPCQPQFYRKPIVLVVILRAQGLFFAFVQADWRTRHDG
jgi:hypothetical protein